MSTISEQLALPLVLPPSFRRQDFVTSPANAVALAQIGQWRGWPGGKLALAGPEGSGKSHLAHIWAAEAGGVILTPDDLRATPADALAHWGRVAVEDADRLAGDREAEVALFHLHNLVLADGGRLLLTGREEPARWPVRLPDLASRLAATPLARLEAPDDALLSAVLAKLFTDRQLVVGPPLIDWLVRRMERTLEAARRTVELIDRRALAEGRAVGQRLAGEVLDALDREAVRDGGTAGAGGHPAQAETIHGNGP